jgi:two-component system cell cycle sensor histidine kinase PleC
MSIQARENPDKTIVERRVAHAGSKSRLAVKNLRAGLGSTSTGNRRDLNGFEMDIRGRHARLQKSTMVVSIFVFTVVAAISQCFLPKPFIGLWFGLGVGLAALGYRLAENYLTGEPEEQSDPEWGRKFIFLRILTGLMWAVLFVMALSHDEVGGIPTLALSAMLVVGCLALLQTRFLKFGVPIEVLPSVIVFTAMLVMQPSLVSLGVAALILATLVFFHLVAESMRNAFIDYLKANAERYQLNMELEASRSISDEARRRAEESNLAKSRFLATMSHELRTPLNAILGFSEVMTNEIMGPIGNAHYKEYLGDIHRSGSHLLQLINEILDLSRVEAGRYDLNEESTSLAHSAEESQQMIKLRAAQKNVSIVTQIQPDLPQIWADSRAIRQVILNLLSNALKFTPSGGTIWLKVGWTAGGGQYVSIKDTGPGIPEEEIPIVLSSFGQGSIAIKSAEQGTGLGLPIVQALVHMHDGTFDLKSKLREGTEVIATFPKSRIMEEVPAVAVEGLHHSRFSNNFSGIRRKVRPPGMAE